MKHLALFFVLVVAVPSWGETYSCQLKDSQSINYLFLRDDDYFELIFKIADHNLGGQMHIDFENKSYLKLKQIRDSVEAKTYFVDKITGAFMEVSVMQPSREPPENVTVKGFIKEDMKRIITGLLLTLMSTVGWCAGMVREKSLRREILVL
jgi:hypothetical protein